MSDEIDHKLIDKRVVQRYIRRGRLDEKDYERHLKSLPDLLDQAVPVVSSLDDDDFVDAPVDALVDAPEEQAPAAIAAEPAPAAEPSPEPGKTEP